MGEVVITNESFRAELDIQITTAKAYPRDVKKSIEKAIYLATLDEETAEQCIFSLPRGKDKDGKQQIIKGESIRLAEIAVYAFGNIHYGKRICANDGKTVTGQGVAWDLENNVKNVDEIQRSIIGKYGVFSQDMQVMTGNAAAAIAQRNAIFKVIPKVLIKPIYEAAKKKAIGDQTQLSEKVKKLFDRFKKLSIEREKILTYFGKKDESEITADEVEEMIGIGTAIKDNLIPLDKAFVEDTETLMNAKAQALEDKLNAAKLNANVQAHIDAQLKTGSEALDKQKTSKPEPSTKDFIDAMGDPQ